METRRVREVDTIAALKDKVTRQVIDLFRAGAYVRSGVVHERDISDSVDATIDVLNDSGHLRTDEPVERRGEA